MVKISKEKCIGCGACAAICPDCFEMEEGKAVVKAGCNAPCVKDAVAGCPVQAISA